MSTLLEGFVLYLLELLFLVIVLSVISLMAWILSTFAEFSFRKMSRRTHQKGDDYGS